MAENTLYSQPEARETNEVVALSREMNIEVEEIDISEYNKNLSKPKCEMCVVKKPLTESMAVFLCCLCEVYVCDQCRPDHRLHKGMRVGGKESKREKENGEIVGGRTNTKGKILGRTIEEVRGEEESGREKGREESDRMERTEEKRMGEQIETERKRKDFLDDLFKESETERKDKFEKNHVNIYDRVKVKHELDREDCRITGLCGLDNKKWVVCDYLNSCIKIFSLGSNLLQRYIRFGTQPWDITEIDFNQKSTIPNLVSGSRCDTLVTDRVVLNKQSLIAVTFLGKCQILLIDLEKKPAFTQKQINTEERCYSIEFYNGKIFTACRQGDRNSDWSIYIKSIFGDTLGKFNIEIYLYYGPRLAVINGKVYLTDYLSNTVQCRDVEGHVISEIKIKGSDPVGISVDLSNNVYVSAWGHDKVYTLDPNLTRYASVLDQSSSCIERCHALCYYKDKLFLGHHWLSTLENFVTVIRLL